MPVGSLNRPLNAANVQWQTANSGDRAGDVERGRSVPGTACQGSVPLPGQAGARGKVY